MNPGVFPPCSAVFQTAEQGGGLVSFFLIPGLKTGAIQDRAIFLNEGLRVQPCVDKKSETDESV